MCRAREYHCVSRQPPIVSPTNDLIFDQNSVSSNQIEPRLDHVYGRCSRNSHQLSTQQKLEHHFAWPLQSSLCLFQLFLQKPLVLQEASHLSTWFPATYEYLPDFPFCCCYWRYILFCKETMILARWLCRQTRVLPRT